MASARMLRDMAGRWNVQTQDDEAGWSKLDKIEGLIKKHGGPRKAQQSIQPTAPVLPSNTRAHGNRLSRHARWGANVGTATGAPIAAGMGLSGSIEYRW